MSEYLLLKWELQRSLSNVFPKILLKTDIKKRDLVLGPALVSDIL